MSKFVKTLLVLFSVYALAVILIFFGFRYISHSSIKRDGLSKDICIFGNSHAVQSLDPQVLNGKTNRHFVNYGNNGQAMFWAVQGIEKKIEQAGISTVIIEFTNNTLLTDQWIYDNARMLNEKDKIYQLDMDEVLFLFRNNPSKTAKLLLCMPVPGSELRGGFEKNDNKIVINSYTDSVHRSKAKECGGIDIVNTARYKKYESLLRTINKYFGVKFIVYRAPMHPKYYEIYANDRFERKFADLLNQLNELPNCKTYDFGRMLLEDTLYADIEHLNSMGAYRFSAVFADSIKADLSN